MTASAVALCSNITCRAVRWSKNVSRIAFCKDSIRPTLPAPQAHATHAMIGVLVKDQRRPITGWKDVGSQVHQVDLPPDTATLGNCLLIGEAGIAMKIGCRIPEGRIAQGEEPGDV